MTAPPEVAGDSAAEETVPCMACGRLLRDDESRRLRIGPTCLARLQAALPRPRARYIGTHTAVTHPRAVPLRRPAQMEFEIWDDDEPDEDDDLHRPRPMADVPTGTLL